MSVQPISNHNVINVIPVTPTIGARVENIDFTIPMTDEVQAELYQALLDWKVLFFPADDITTDQHLDFARNFGDLEVHPFAPHKPDYPEVLAITHNEEFPGGENLWHSDVTWRLEPSLGSILRCLECPEVGGDTLFADMYQAYEGLPETVKDMIDGKYARHDFEGFRVRLRKRGMPEDKIEEFISDYPNPEHPVVRTHPDTGRRALYVNLAFTKEIIGMSKEDSDRMLDYLYRQANTPEYQCRFKWQKNGIIFWDNRSCQHYAASDYWPQKRQVERVTIKGDKPFYDPSKSSTSGGNDHIKGVVLRRQQGQVMKF